MRMKRIVAATATALLLAGSATAGNPLISDGWMRRADAGDVRRVLAKGADPHEETRSGGTALNFAAFYGNLDAIRVLIEEVGVDPNRRTSDLGSTAVFSARDAETVALLVRLGASLALEDKWGFTALHWAARDDRIDAARGLLDHGMQVDILGGKFEMTPLMRAANLARRPETAAFFIGAGADVNRRSLEEVTPLHAAAKHNSPAMVELLLEHGADPTVVTKLGWTAHRFGTINRKLRRSAALKRLKAALDEQAAGQTRTYGCDGHLVQSGESLGGIAGASLGNPDRWIEIRDLNGIPKGGRHRVGQCLELPAK